MPADGSRVFREMLAHDGDRFIDLPKIREDSAAEKLNFEIVRDRRLRKNFDCLIAPAGLRERRCFPERHLCCIGITRLLEHRQPKLVSPGADLHLGAIQRVRVFRELELRQSSGQQGSSHVSGIASRSQILAQKRRTDQGEPAESTLVACEIVLNESTSAQTRSS